MPSIVRSKNWYVRITAPHEFLADKIKSIKQWIDYDGLFAGFHIGEKTDKPHVHIALKIKNELQKQSLDKRLKDLFGVKGADYSSKVWDASEDALSYMYHDKEVVVDNCLQLDVDAIERIKARNVQVQKIVAEAKEKASNKVVDYVLHKIAQSGNWWSMRDIAFEIWKGVHSGQFYHPGHQYKRYVEEIFCRQCKDEEELGITFDTIFKNMYPGENNRTY